MKRYFLVLLLLAFSASAFAIGGGGGGGSSGGGSGGGGGGGSSCGGVCKLACLSSGAIQFESANTEQPIEARKLPDGAAFGVPGWWVGYSFQSEEALFNEAGDYEVNGQRVMCPGLSFSCKLSNIKIESCTRTANGIMAVYSAPNTDLDNIKIGFKDSNGRTLFYDKKARSGGLNIKFSNDSGKKIVAADYGTPLETIEIRDTRCTGRYIVADSASCQQAAAQAEKKKFRCADFISMFDRVKCRLSLSGEEQEGQLALQYLPEQCAVLSGQEQDACVNGYQQLRQCQIYNDSDKRVACAKETIDMRSSFAEQCGQRADKDACRQEFNQKTYQLVIFRLYELEEKAEEWLAEGRTDLQTATDFVTLVESAKIKFNEVRTLDDKKNVILGVRDIWKEFVKEVK